MSVRQWKERVIICLWYVFISPLLGLCWLIGGIYDLLWGPSLSELDDLILYALSENNRTVVEIQRLILEYTEEKVLVSRRMIERRLEVIIDSHKVERAAPKIILIRKVEFNRESYPLFEQVDSFCLKCGVFIDKQPDSPTRSWLTPWLMRRLRISV